MSTISINNEVRPLHEADADWITDQVNGRRRDDVPVCIAISIRSSRAHIILTTSGCRSNGGRGGGRPPNRHEREVRQLWVQHCLDQPDFPVGQLVAFVKQVPRLL